MYAPGSWIVLQGGLGGVLGLGSEDWGYRDIRVMVIWVWVGCFVVEWLF
jgi:ABC-type phosphate/phosphonate transport system permease subunit